MAKLELKEFRCDGCGFLSYGTLRTDGQGQLETLPKGWTTRYHRLEAIYCGRCVGVSVEIQPR